MKLIVGLGNPGANYLRTRHNVGFMVVGSFLDDQGLQARAESRFKASLAEGRIGGERVAFAMPNTYMNLSGEAVQALLHWYKLKPDDLIVIYDDFAIPLGTVRARPDGSAGGHNGIHSLIQHLGTSQFPRIRVGIGPLPPHLKSPDFVLGTFSSGEQALLADGLKQATLACVTLVTEGMAVTMQRFNAKVAPTQAAN